MTRPGFSSAGLNAFREWKAWSGDTLAAASGRHLARVPLQALPRKQWGFEANKQEAGVRDWC